MNALKFAIAFTLVIAATAANAGRDKILVCHVGNETGPFGETYFDDPDCVPSDLNNYFCPDAGKIDLIVVPANSKHLGNPSHAWDGIEDYDPIAMGASGDGTEDADGDGIDEGCEIPSDCPCWDEIELLQVTAANQYSQSSCNTASGDFDYPVLAVIQDDQFEIDDGVEGGFLALNDGNVRLCDTRDEENFQSSITAEEANACIEQIADRCAAIGSDIR